MRKISLFLLVALIVCHINPLGASECKLNVIDCFHWVSHCLFALRGTWAGASCFYSVTITVQQALLRQSRNSQMFCEAHGATQWSVCRPGCLWPHKGRWTVGANQVACLIRPLHQDHTHWRAVCLCCGCTVETGMLMHNSVVHPVVAGHIVSCSRCESNIY